MARTPNTGSAKQSKSSRAGAEKMQMNHRRTRKQIQRIYKEAAKRLETGKPAHTERAYRR